MKITVYSVALLASLSLSGRASAFDAIVDVLSVTPVREIVNEPYESCGTEYEQQTVQSAPPVQENHPLAGAIAGGVAGGLLGSLIGEGNGKVAAAAVGAGLGAIAGDRLSRYHTTNPGETHTSVMPVQRCKMVDHYDVRTHYNVIYEYNGQQFSTKLPYDPGRQMKVNVSVTPK